ncbi:MAG TPA: ATPase [Prolixibacteraceae bacterium]|nr:ATPase [Prolixibacteraceae bacterium]
MILIADSGTTKTEWCIITDNETTESLVTSGINPFYQEAENISSILQREFTATKKFDSIYFYGAGCINQEKQDIVRKSLLQIFETSNIFIGSDLLAAAHSLCQDLPGVACILGTGSNSCYYNGGEIVANVSPLGFILGDEGSGAVLGKKLVGDILKKQLPQILINDFFEAYHTTAAEILENVYKKPFPSRYLANYTKFLSKNIKHPEIENIVISSFREFVTRNLMQYPGIERTPIHFTGSIAFHFEVQLRKAIEEQHLILGNIERAPMNGLIKYHNSKISI